MAPSGGQTLPLPPDVVILGSRPGASDYKGLRMTVTSLVVNRLDFVLELHLGGAPTVIGIAGCDCPLNNSLT